jgi:hypothetical protein
LVSLAKPPPVEKQRDASSTCVHREWRARATVMDTGRVASVFLYRGRNARNRPLPCSDRAGGRGCRERLFRQLGLCLVYAPPLHGESGMMELDDLAQLRPEGLLQSALDIDEQAVGERISETGRKPRADGAHREIGARGCCSIFIIAVMCGKVSTARARFSKEKSVANSSRHARIPRSARGDPMRPPRPPRVYVHA